MNSNIKIIWTQARQVVPQNEAVTLLRIGEQQTQVATGDKEQGTPTLHVLPIGLQKIGKGVLGNFPPTGAVLEQAIEVLEDHIMPLSKLLPQASILVLVAKTTHYFQRNAIKNTQALKGAAYVFEMSIETVEDIFQRLAEVSQGGAPSVRGLPVDMDFVATTLVVREFMHHLGFKCVLVLP